MDLAALLSNFETEILFQRLTNRTGDKWLERRGSGAIGRVMGNCALEG